MTATAPTESPEERLSNAGKRVCSYDIDAIDHFLTEVVFHAEFRDDEHVLTWSTKAGVGFPKSEADTLKKLSRTREGLACYYATSTSTPTPDGKLYNRKS